MEERLKQLNNRAAAQGQYVLYWMQQSQRAHYNHALEFAVDQANNLRKPLLVLFVLTGGYPEANLRHYRFMLEGLSDTMKRLRNRGIRMIVLQGEVVKTVVRASRQACILVTDRGYLRIQREWRRDIAGAAECPCIQVESDVVVPIEAVSEKEQYTAGTIRPRIHRQLEFYLLPIRGKELLFPSLSVEPDVLFPGAGTADAGPVLAEGNIRLIEDSLELDRSVKPVDWIHGGTTEALARLEDYIDSRLAYFDERRNDPAEDYLSHMSPYLHFGQISALYIALQVGEANTPAVASYLEELIVRRELAMNFVYFNPDYDSYQCLPGWAGKTLLEHELDPRPYVYRLNELEQAGTHDDYWNAAQKELMSRGKMHGYMRMYWGKKILEWSPGPAEAFETALYLNNRYSIDGRDANGFAGVAWCFGKHDRAWSERPVFGKVRYMNDRGLERKFRIREYVSRIG